MANGSNFSPSPAVCARLHQLLAESRCGKGVFLPHPGDSGSCTLALCCHPLFGDRDPGRALPTHHTPSAALSEAWGRALCTGVVPPKFQFPLISTISAAVTSIDSHCRLSPYPARSYRGDPNWLWRAPQSPHPHHNHPSGTEEGRDLADQGQGVVALTLPLDGLP